jgi:hypothetical protein
MHQMVARAAAREREPPIVMYHQGQPLVQPQQELGADPPQQSHDALVAGVALIVLQSSATGTPALIKRRTRRGTAIT